MADNNKYLDKEEEDIIESFERGEWEPAKNLQERLQTAREIAFNTISKNRAINIEIPEVDFLKIEAKARIVGVAYPALISAILHQYAEGQIKGVL